MAKGKEIADAWFDRQSPGGFQHSRRELAELIDAMTPPNPGWPNWSVAPGHCEHAEDYDVLEDIRVCGWRTGLCAGPCPSCPNIDTDYDPSRDM
jgi:hypothetical protein